MLDLVHYGDLRKLLQSRHRRITNGCSGSEIYYLPALAAYLKVCETGKLSDLRREREVLLWLAGKLNVPKVLGFAAGEGREAILVSEIEGVPALDDVSGSDATAERVKAFVQKTASAMRQIHDIRIGDCPFDQRLDVKLHKALENIRKGLLDESDFECEHEGKTTLKLYKELLNERPESEDLVFTHGDLCLPNIIVSNEEIAGFIDLDTAGVADRYHDIALFERSLRRNSRGAVDFEDVFCEAYGIDGIDHQKLYYYRKLDELF